MRIRAVAAVTAASAILGLGAMVQQQPSQPPTPPAPDQPSSAPAAPAATQRAWSKAPQAFLTSKKVVYALGEPIDLTYAVTAADAPVTTRFSIVNEAGQAAPAIKHDGKYLWGRAAEPPEAAAPTGSNQPGQARSESLPDLRQWYEFHEPGVYEVSFDGIWTDYQDQPQRITSNTVVVKIADGASPPPDEENAGGSILLSSVWALDMPNTMPMDVRMIASTPRRYIAKEGKLVSEIKARISSGYPLRVPMKPGFIVSGTGMEALAKAHSTIVSGADPEDTFGAGEQLSIVFCTRSSERYIHIDSIVKGDTIVNVTYSAVIHDTCENTIHLALIPITFDSAMTAHIEFKPSISTLELPSSVDHLSRVIPASFQVQVVDDE